MDELNSWIGLLSSVCLENEIQNRLGEIQVQLFNLGSRVASAMSENGGTLDVSEDFVQELESQIDAMEGQLEPLTSFILPGGGRWSSQVHVARSVCRRTERRLVAWVHSGANRVDLTRGLVLLNRLSDYLFVLARYANYRQGVQEVSWMPESE